MLVGLEIEMKQETRNMVHRRINRNSLEPVTVSVSANLCGIFLNRSNGVMGLGYNRDIIIVSLHWMGLAFCPRFCQLILDFLPYTTFHAMYDVDVNVDVEVDNKRLKEMSKNFVWVLHTTPQ